MYRLIGLLTTSGENFKSTAPSEIYLLRKKVTCSILILPIYIYKKLKININKILTKINNLFYPKTLFYSKLCLECYALNQQLSAET